MKKPRPPTADDYKTLRRLCDAAGNRDILNRWIDAALSAAKQRRGPKSYQYPKSMPIELMYLLAEPGVTRTEAIKQWIRHKDVSGRGTEKSTIAHVNKHSASLPM
jgi:hypothetical protein